MLKKIVIFGAQGSGKGTQAELLARACGLVYISTGDIFRQEIKNQTDLGKEVSEIIQAGQLVSDEITNQIVAKRINKPDCKAGFVLDGYPRNKIQLKFLNSLAEITEAVAIKISNAEALRRLEGRLACVCGLSYHPLHNPPKIEGVCDSCGKKLFVRDDDKPEAIKKRLGIYHQETEPLFDIYRQKGILREINGEQPIKKVFKEMVKALGLRCEYPKQNKSKFQNPNVKSMSND